MGAQVGAANAAIELRLHRNAEKPTHQPIHQEVAGVADMADTSGPFPCSGIAGFASFTLRLNEARLSN